MRQGSYNDMQMHDWPQEAHPSFLGERGVTKVSFDSATRLNNTLFISQPIAFKTIKQWL